MRALAEFIMRGRVQACLVALVGVVVPLVGPAAIGLVTVTEGSFDDYEVSGSVDQTGSYLAPFITTIGLYDNDNNMVVVAKLPKPIKSLPR